MTLMPAVFLIIVILSGDPAKSQWANFSLLYLYKLNQRYHKVYKV